MNTADMAKLISTKHSLSQKDGRAIVNTLLTSIQSEVKKGNRVSLTGFGTFDRITRKARKGRNPLTGENIKIRASKAPRFKPGKIFKTVVNGKKK